MKTYLPSNLIAYRATPRIIAFILDYRSRGTCLDGAADWTKEKMMIKKKKKLKKK
jgi:hypothetical protein